MSDRAAAHSIALPPPIVRRGRIKPTRTASGSYLSLTPTGRLFSEVFVDRVFPYSDEARAVLAPLGEDLSMLYHWRAAKAAVWIPQFTHLGYLYVPSAAAGVGVAILWAAEHGDLRRAREVASSVREAVAPLGESAPKRVLRERAILSYADVLAALLRSG